MVYYLLQNYSLKGITTVPCWLSAATQQRRGLASTPSLIWQTQATSQRTSIKKTPQPSSKHLPSSHTFQPYSPITVFICFGTVPAQKIGNTFTDKDPQLDTAGQRSKLMTRSAATAWHQAGCARLWQAISACTERTLLTRMYMGSKESVRIFPGLLSHQFIFEMCLNL